MKRYFSYFLILIISCVMLLPAQIVTASDNRVFLYSDDTIDDYQGQSTICITKDATFKNISLNSKFDQVKKITFTDDVESLPSKVFFQFPNVEVIELPDNLESLGIAFYPMYLDDDYDHIHPIYSLTKLKSIKIDDSNSCFAVEDDVLYSKDMTELLYYPSGKDDKVYVMPEFVTQVLDCALLNNPYLEEIKIGTRFGASYWLENNVELPNLKKYSVAMDNYYLSEINGVLFNYDQTELIAYPAGKKVETYIVPSTVKKLRNYSMKGATIGSVILPSGLEEVYFESYYSPFKNSKIGAVKITDNNLYTTQDGVLYTKNLDSLVYWPSDKKVTELIFPSTLKRLSINKNTIPCISEVTQLTIPRDLSEVNSVRDIDSLSTIKVEKGNESFALYSGCLYTSGYSQLIIIPPSIKQTTITIPSQYRFYYFNEINSAPSVNTVVIEGTGEEFPYELFPNLAQIKLGKNNKSAKVVNNVLYSASMKKLIWYPQNKKDSKFIIPSSVTALCSNAFRGQNYLQSITLSKNLKYQQSMRWFEGCKKLKEINVATGNKYFTAVDGVLFTKDMKTLIYYPVSKTTKSYTIPEKTEVFTIMTGNQYLTNLKLSKNLRNISLMDYESCFFKNLTSITVPTSNKKFTCVDSVLYSIGYDNSCSLEIYPMGKRSQSFTIPKDVTYIVCEKSFELHPYLKNLTSQSPYYDVYGKMITYSYEY